MESLKTCSKCREVKKVSFFTKDNTRLDGLRPWCSDCAKKYYYDNKVRLAPILREVAKRYYHNNKEKIKKYREGRRVQRLDYMKNRIKSNKSIYLSINMKCAFSAWIRKGCINKCYVTNYLGITHVQFKAYFESLFRDGMGWKNYGKKWQIDHIRPRIRFDHTKESELYKCWNYKNLQPLTPLENNIKCAS